MVSWGFKKYQVVSWVIGGFKRFSGVFEASFRKISGDLWDAGSFRIVAESIRGVLEGFKSTSEALREPSGRLRSILLGLMWFQVSLRAISRDFSNVTGCSKT